MSLSRAKLVTSVGHLLVETNKKRCRSIGHNNAQKELQSMNLSQPRKKQTFFFGNGQIQPVSKS
jgi:hypothetical protein